MQFSNIQIGAIILPRVLFVSCPSALCLSQRHRSGYTTRTEVFSVCYCILGRFRSFRRFETLSAESGNLPFTVLLERPNVSGWVLKMHKPASRNRHFSLWHKQGLKTPNILLIGSWNECTPLDLARVVKCCSSISRTHGQSDVVITRRALWRSTGTYDTCEIVMYVLPL